jgi:hypothetical protein
MQGLTQGGGGEGGYVSSSMNLPGGGGGVAQWWESSILDHVRSDERSRQVGVSAPGGGA